MDVNQMLKDGNVEFFKTAPLYVIENYRDTNDPTLACAAADGQLECSKVIYERCPSQLFSINSYSHTALHHITYYQSHRVDLLDYFLKIGAKHGIESYPNGENLRFKQWVLHRNGKGETALMRGFSSRNLEMARLWMKVDVEYGLGLLWIADNDKNSPLHLAVGYQDLELVKVLTDREQPDFELGANNIGETPLLMAMKLAQSPKHLGDDTAARIRRRLLEKQPNQSKVRIGAKGWTSLHHAASKGDLGAFDDILQFCFDCTQLVDTDGRNFLHIAVKCQKLDMVKHILETNQITESILNGRDNKGNTPLHLAAGNENKDIVLCLLYDHRVDKMIMNANDQKALDLVSREVIAVSVEQMLEDGNVEFFKTAHLDALESYRDQDENPALACAATKGRLECCKVIYERCPSQLFSANKDENTILHQIMSCQSGNIELLEFFLHIGAKADHDIESGLNRENVQFKRWLQHQNDKGETALTRGFPVRNLEMTRLWMKVDIEYGLELLWITDNEKNTPLHLAVGYQDLELVKVLTDRSEQPNFNIYPNDKGDTPLLMAMNLALSPKIWGDETPAKIRRRLLEKQPNQSKVRIGDDGWTSLHHAASKGDLGACDEIIEFCEDCADLIDKEGRNFLHIAVNYQQTELVKRVLEPLRITISVLNRKDKKGNTPLHLAAENGNRDMVECLLYESNVNKMIVNANDQKAIDLINFEYDKKKAEVYGVRDRMNEKELKDQSDFDLVVCALIATLSFTAGITVPGGYISDGGPHSGLATLSKSTSFKAFVISNNFALVFSLYAVFSHFCTRRLLRRDEILYQLDVATRCTLGAIYAMMVAFITGSYAVLAISRSLSITVCAISSCFFIFALTPIFRILRQGKRVGDLLNRLGFSSASPMVDKK